MTMPFEDETIRGLRETIDEHRQGGGDARALQALEGLGAIRDDRALRHIYAVATHSSGKLKKRAAQILGDVCRQRGLSQDELEDRIVPELGLDERGTIAFDFGARRFTVGFDELLRPFVCDDGGARLAAFPHASGADDVDKVRSAAALWKNLKRDVESIGKEQTHRLERAMCGERTWSLEGFTTRLVSHRLLGHLARRLVYGVVRDKNIVTTFRVAEDKTFADQNDAPVVLEPDALVAIVHPVRLTESDLARWKQIFIDYKTVQPFHQLDRELVALSAEELQGTTLTRFAGTVAHGGSFFGLRDRGWQDDASGVTKRLVPANVRATLAITPGFPSFARLPPDQTLGDLVLYGRTFGALAPITRAELLHEVSQLRAR